MQTRIVETSAGRIFVLVFDPGDEVIAGLTEVCRREGIRGAHFTGIGAFREATLAYFDVGKQSYDETRLVEQVEALSLVGNLGRLDGEPRVHAHAVVGRSDGSTGGGHLVRAIVDPTLEIIVTELPIELRRAPHPQTGLALLRLPEVDEPGG